MEITILTGYIIHIGATLNVFALMIKEQMHYALLDLEAAHVNTVKPL